MVTTRVRGTGASPYVPPPPATTSSSSSGGAKRDVGRVISGQQQSLAANQATNAPYKGRKKKKKRGKFMGYGADNQPIYKTTPGATFAPPPPAAAPAAAPPPGATPPGSSGMPPPAGAPVIPGGGNIPPSAAGGPPASAPSVLQAELGGTTTTNNGALPAPHPALAGKEPPSAVMDIGWAHRFMMAGLPGTANWVATMLANNLGSTPQAAEYIRNFQTQYGDEIAANGSLGQAVSFYKRALNIANSLANLPLPFPEVSLPGTDFDIATARKQMVYGAEALGKWLFQLSGLPYPDASVATMAYGGVVGSSRSFLEDAINSTRPSPSMADTMQQENLGEWWKEKMGSGNPAHINVLQKRGAQF